MQVSQIVFYTRPWEVRFHVELARQLQPHFPAAPVRFVTFFDAAARCAREAGHEVIYLPDALASCEPAPEHPQRLSALDREIQAELGVGLNHLAVAERFLPKDATKAEDFIRRHAIVLDRLVAPNTLSVSATYDHFIYWLAGTLANARQGWHFAFEATAVPRGGVLAYRSPWEPWFVEGTARQALTLEGLREQITDPTVQIEYMKPDPLPPVHRRWRGRARFHWSNRTDKLRGSYFARFSWPHFLFGTEWFRRALLTPPSPDYAVQGVDAIEAVTGGRPFFYVPLHVEPEASVLMYSPWLQCQVEMCRLLAQALPVGALLLVKENPYMHRKRPLSYYRQLGRLPGVRLVAPDVPSTALIQGAKGVISLAGSACFEAAILGTPSLVFGRPAFRRFLATADFTGQGTLRLDALTSWMKSPLALSDDALRKAVQAWATATFPASATPRRHGQLTPEMDASPDNVARYRQFIQGAVSAGRSDPIAAMPAPQREDAV